MINKIDSLEQTFEYDHEKILEIYNTMDEFSTEYLVQKEKIDFLTPFIGKAEAQQILNDQPVVSPQDLALKSLEKKFK